MKKNTITLIFAIVALSATSNPLSAAVALPSNAACVQLAEAPATLNVNKASLEKSLGRKLNFREKWALRLAKKKINKHFKSNEALANEGAGTENKTGKLQLVALLLCFFLGLLGIHRFYLGYNGMGILYIFTLGLFGIGTLIDFILLIIPNGLTPKGETTY